VGDTAGGRDAVLRIVGRHGPVTANAAAVLLGVTPAAVRRHLDTLTAAGLADAHEPGGSTLRRRGRPARSYVLTGQGRTALGRSVGGPEPTVGGPEDLAADALDFIARTHGAEAVARFAHQRAKAMESRFTAVVLAAGLDPGDRSRALAEALEAEGYAATARPVATGVQLCQGRCPVHRVAAAHPELCEAETAAFGRLLGVPVQRLATLAGGAHVCTTHVVSRQPTNAPAPAPTRTLVPPTTPAPTTTRRRVPVASGRDRP
jgi:predicted ArsR family transcriptional regulator